MIKTRDAKGKNLKTLPKTALKDLKKYKKRTFINKISILANKFVLNGFLKKFFKGFYSLFINNFNSMQFFEH